MSIDPPGQWFNADQVKPWDLAPNPRCHDCQTGGMKHPAHPSRRCGIRVDGIECVCEPSASTFAPTL
jgi:hypothetical protein